MNKKIEGMKVIITIVDRGNGDKIVKLFEERGCHYHLNLLGEGTAPKEILEYLGFGIVEKDVVFSFVDNTLATKLMQVLIDECDFDRPGRGVACSIPISSIGGLKALNHLIEKKGETR